MDDEPISDFEYGRVTGNDLLKGLLIVAVTVAALMIGVALIIWVAK